MLQKPKIQINECYICHSLMKALFINNASSMILMDCSSSSVSYADQTKCNYASSVPAESIYSSTAKVKLSSYLNLKLHFQLLQLV